MSPVPSRAAPAVVRPTSLDRSSQRNFLSEIVIDYGPEDVLARLFLKADTAMRELGIVFSFSTFEELVAVNKANPKSWRPLVPMFDPDVSDVTYDNAFSILGRNAAGEVVTAHACRLYPLTETTLKEETESLRLFYRDPDAERLPGEAMHVTAPTAATRKGRCVFIGAVWYRPDYRKLNMMPMVSPAVRALAFTRWYTDFAFSFMAPELVKAGMADKARFLHVEDEVTMVNTPMQRNGIINASLVWTDDAEQLQHFRDYVGEPSARADPQVDGIIHNRAANQ